MTPDERQRAMDFILKSQADSVVRMERFDEAQRQSDEARRQSDEARHQLERQQIATQSELDTLVLVTRDLLAISRHTIRRVENLESGENRP
jgi:hypothetical protein